MAINRSDVRKQMAALLRLEVEAIPDNQIFDHKISSTNGATPLIVLASAGSERPPRAYPRFAIAVNCMVLYSEESEGYTRSDAEDLIDLIESQVAAVVEKFQGYDNIFAIDYEGRSLLDEFSLNGVPYLCETIVLVAGVTG